MNKRIADFIQRKEEEKRKCVERLDEVLNGGNKK